MKVQVYTDGACRGNPGPAGIGIAIKQANKTILEVAEYIGKTTNNIAEYKACIKGLEEAITLGATEVELYADSELLVKQIKGEYRVKNEGLIPLHFKIKSLISKLKSFKITHTLRDGNEHADELANRGIDEHSVV